MITRCLSWGIYLCMDFILCILKKQTWLGQSKQISFKVRRNFLLSLALNGPDKTKYFTQGSVLFRYLLQQRFSNAPTFEPKVIKCPLLATFTGFKDPVCLRRKKYLARSFSRNWGTVFRTKLNSVLRNRDSESLNKKHKTCPNSPLERKKN